MRFLLRITVVVAALVALAGVASAARESAEPSLFDASRRLSLEAHVHQVWFEGEGADYFPSDDRQEIEGGLLLAWNLGEYLDATFSATQGFESQKTTLRAGFSLLLRRARE